MSAPHVSQHITGRAVFIMNMPPTPSDTRYAASYLAFNTSVH